VRLIKELVVLAKAKPGAITYGSSGAGGVRPIAVVDRRPLLSSQNIQFSFTHKAFP
jgi:hypothetical protein